MEVSEQVSGLERLFPGGLFQGDCPTRTVLDHVTSKWGVLVLVALSRRTARWSELRRSVTGVSEKMLAQTLHTLERDQLVRRHAHAVIPPHVDYTLTPWGEEVVERLVPLMAWVADHADAITRGPGAAPDEGAGTDLTAAGAPDRDQQRTHDKRAGS